MPQPRRLSDEQESAALSLYRAGLTICAIAKTYNLTWYGMKGCLDRAAARETVANVGSTGNYNGAAP